MDHRGSRASQGDGESVMNLRTDAVPSQTFERLADVNYGRSRPETGETTASTNSHICSARLADGKKPIGAIGLDSWHTVTHGKDLVQHPDDKLMRALPADKAST